MKFDCQEFPAPLKESRGRRGEFGIWNLGFGIAESVCGFRFADFMLRHYLGCTFHVQLPKITSDLTAQFELEVPDSQFRNPQPAMGNQIPQSPIPNSKSG
jgi:hypothetical protein